jgi:glutamate racemase
LLLLTPTHASATPADASAHTDAHPRSADPIGVFDSGVGGLSVLRALRQELPLERFVYVADNAHAPYGERDDTHLITRSHAIARHLVEHHYIKTLVVACNTATAAAIHRLRQHHAALPIVGIEPALKPAAKQSQTKTIGVLATRSTLASEKFRALLDSLRSSANFVVQPCDGLADAIERNDAPAIAAACARYTLALGPFGTAPGAIDTLVLGCTHYPFVSSTLAGLVGDQVTFLEGGAPVARQTRKLLAERGWLAQPHANADRNLAPMTFETTGSADILRLALQRWLQLDVPVHTLQID